MRTCSDPMDAPDVIERLQERADRNIRRFGLLPSTEEGGELPGAA